MAPDTQRRFGGGRTSWWNPPDGGRKTHAPGAEGRDNMLETVGLKEARGMCTACRRRDGVGGPPGPALVATVLSPT